MNNGGQITVKITLDDAQYNAATAAAQARTKTVANAMNGDVAAATQRTEDRFASLGTVAATALKATAVGAGIAGVASVKMAGDFEQSLNVLRSVSGATDGQMQQLAATARQLGQDAALPGVSAKDAAAAMVELAKAGVGVNDTMGAAKGVLSLAKAGQLEVADAATITARALNAFGLEGNQASRVADVLAAGANSSSADVNEMAYALSMAGSSASRMGVSLQDTITALGVFSNAGVNGSDAGTSLKTMLQRLAAPTSEASAAMKELGLNFFDASGKFVGLESTADQLNKKLAGLTQQQREQALATIFGADSSRVAGILAKEGAAGFNEMSKAVNKQGAATDLAKAQNSGFNGALDNLISTLETVGTDLGTKVLPPLTALITTLAAGVGPAVDFVTQNFNWLAPAVIAVGAAFATIRIAGVISDFAKATKTLELFIGAKNAAGVRAIGSAFSGVISGAKTAASAIASATASAARWAAASVAAAARATAAWVAQKATIVAGFIAQGVAALAQAAIMTAAWVGSALAATAAWVVAHAAILGPIALIVAAVVAAVALIIANWDSIKAFMASLWEGIKTVVSNVINGIIGVVNSVITWVKANWPLLLAILTGPIGMAVLLITQNWETIKQAFANAVNFVKNIWSSITGFFSGITSGIANHFNNLVSGISGAFNNAVNFVRGIPGKILSALGNLGGLLAGAGRDMIQGLINGISGMMGAILGKIRDMGGSIVSTFKNMLGIHSPSRVFEGFGQNIGQGAINGVSSMMTQAKAVAGQLANSFMLGGSAMQGSLALAADETGGGRGVTQINNVYTDVDMDKVKSDLAWELQR